MTIAQEFADAFSRHDVESLVGCFTDDATYDDLFYGRHRGHDELRKMFERMFTEGRDFTWAMDAVAEADGLEIAEWTFDFVVTDAILRSAGQHLHFRGVSVFELRNGRCCAYREYFDKGAALVQLGFAPDSLWRTLSR